MNFDQEGVPLKELLTLFSFLLILGAGLCVQLYKYHWRKFIKSSLFIKIIFWIPIFTVFVGVLYANNLLRLTVMVLLLLAVLYELKNYINLKNKYLILIYFVIFTLSFSHFYFIETGYTNIFINLLITICFATVLADVFAFFFGNYLGRHKLPAALNNNKSWEGVAGEFAGATAGVLLVNQFVVESVSIWIFIPIGLGAIIGDLANSYVKRKVKIKEWSNYLPGHGGFTDRFSSIALSAALTFYFLEIVL
jgi:phosphatidate cytidylyltransferase